MNLKEHIERMSEDTSDRKKRELLLCQAMLTDEQLENISSMNTGYKLARSKLIEDIIKVEDPTLYAKIKNNPTKKRIPIFNIDDIVQSML